MEIIYIITVLMLLVSTVLIKKSDEKQNVLLSITLTAILFTIYNIFLAFVFLLIKVHFSLLALNTQHFSQFLPLATYQQFLSQTF